ncbi:MAG: hypothetical protein KBC67_01270 [Candidatus Pacebacteria bacterium]|nr:hypothetical protein [Candidatus Paceibacterota bacterium]
MAIEYTKASGTFLDNVSHALSKDPAWATLEITALAAFIYLAWKVPQNNPRWFTWRKKTSPKVKLLNEETLSEKQLKALEKLEREMESNPLRFPIDQLLRHRKPAQMVRMTERAISDLIGAYRNPAEVLKKLQWVGLEKMKNRRTVPQTMQKEKFLCMLMDRIDLRHKLNPVRLELWRKLNPSTPCHVWNDLNSRTVVSLPLRLEHREPIVSKQVFDAMDHDVDPVLSPVY